MLDKIIIVKSVLSGHSKIDKTKVLNTNGSLMKVKSIAECSLGAFCNSFDLHLAINGLEKQFLVFFLSGRLRQVLLYSFFKRGHILTFTLHMNFAEADTTLSKDSVNIVHELCGLCLCPFVFQFSSYTLF